MPQGNWVLSNGNTMVTQTLNCDPTMYLSPNNLTNFTMSGTWRVYSVDDDMIGIVFGYQDPSHFYVMDWKQNYQSQAGWGIAYEGFAIRKISAPSVNDFDRYDFWDYRGTTNTEILASYFDTSSGWVINTLYDFHLEFTPGLFTIIVSEGGTELWNVTVNDNSYTNGKFGLYNLSQDLVEYANIDVVPIPSTLLLLGSGIAGLIGINRKRKKI